MTKAFTVWVKNDPNGDPHLSLTDPDLPAPPASPAPVPPPPPPTPPVPGLRTQHRGANVSGGATYYPTWPTSGTGPVAGTHYKFMTPADLDVLLVAGMRTFRVLFSWEALQPKETSSIATLSGNYSIYRDALFGVVGYLRTRGAEVLLDVHSDDDRGFASYRGAKVGTTTPGGWSVNDLLGYLWKQLATYYIADPGVMFGVMNEPHDIDAAMWFTCAQRVIDSIRSTGSRSKIVMPGVDWTGASSWMDRNAAAWNLVDPVPGGLAAQVHLYFDPDAGGGSTAIVSDTIGVQRLTNVVSWARLKGLELWVAEIGLSASNPIAAATWKNTQTFLDANRDVVGGLLWWSAGPRDWWFGYRFTLIGADGRPSPQLKLLTAAGAFA